jgi:hypothetical protein
VTVQDNAGPAVNTDPSSNASALILHDEDLQALSDDPEDLQSDLQALAGPSAGPNGGSIFVDGFSGGELPPKESIREIRINQNPFSPEYDKQDPGGMKARVQSKFLLDEVERFLGYTPDPEKDAGGRLVDHAAEAGINRAKLERLKREVREGRAEILKGDYELALNRFKEAREYWMKPAKKGE